MSSLPFNPDSKVFEEAIISDLSDQVTEKMEGVRPDRYAVLLYIPSEYVENTSLEELKLPGTDYINPNINGLSKALVAGFGVTIVKAYMDEVPMGYKALAIHPYTKNCGTTLPEFQKQITLPHVMSNDDNTVSPYWF